jgi:uncharacterized phosphosugar-binding protein
MDNPTAGAGILRYYEEITRLQAAVIQPQIETLGAIAERMAQVVRKDGRIFIFGTGHSHMLGEEAYFRAGGLAAAVPLFAPQVLMLHESARLSSQLERMPELATPLLDEYDPQPGEILIVYADSGTNALPVQIAIEARQRDLTTVGVCSLKYAQVAPLSPVGKRLYEVVDYAIDNGGTPGDALIQVEGHLWRVAASSTMIGALIWNCLLTETVFLLQAAGSELPVFASYNMAGAADHNQVILQKWSKINPHLPARSLKLKK